MWYSCTRLAIELKIEVLYKRDDAVGNTFCGVVGGILLSKRNNVVYLQN